MENNVTPTPDAKDVADNKVMAILAYIFFLIPLLAAKESPYARYHTNQGLILFILGLALGIIFFILSFALALVAPAILGVIGIISWVVNIGVFALMIMGIINAAQGQMKELPLIGKYKIIK